MSTSFSGLSSYAEDFASVIERAVSIASLPLTQLEDRMSDLEDQVAEYSTLDTELTTLRTAIESLETALTDSSSYSVSVTDSDVLTAEADEGALEGTYTVNVTQLGSYSQYMSTSDLEGSIASGTYTLSVGDGSGNTTDYSISVSGTDMTDLVEAINDSGAAVKASLVNVGTNSSPSYRLSLQSTAMAGVTMSLTGSAGTELLEQNSLGQSMQYTINGESTVLSSDSATIDLSTGLEVTLEAVGRSTITVGRSTSAISTALSSIASAYNTVVTELDENHGESGGALTGMSQVLTLESELRQLLNFKSSSGAGSLACLGLSFDSDGNASFDSEALADYSYADIQEYLGDSYSGFIQNATTLLDDMNGTTSGIITDSVDSLTEQIDKVNDEIDDEETRVALMQTSLEEQMSAADTAIYELEQEASYYESLFDAMQDDESD